MISTCLFCNMEKNAHLGFIYDRHHQGYNLRFASFANKWRSESAPVGVIVHISPFVGRVNKRKNVIHYRLKLITKTLTQLMSPVLTPKVPLRLSNNTLQLSCLGHFKLQFFTAPLHRRHTDTKLTLKHSRQNLALAFILGYKHNVCNTNPTEAFF